MGGLGPGPPRRPLNPALIIDRVGSVRVSVRLFVGALLFEPFDL